MQTDTSRASLQQNQRQQVLGAIEQMRAIPGQQATTRGLNLSADTQQRLAKEGLDVGQVRANVEGVQANTAAQDLANQFAQRTLEARVKQAGSIQEIAALNVTQLRQQIAQADVTNPLVVQQLSGEIERVRTTNAQLAEQLKAELEQRRAQTTLITTNTTQLKQQIAQADLTNPLTVNQLEEAIKEVRTRNVTLGNQLQAELEQRQAQTKLTITSTNQIRQQIVQTDITNPLAVKQLEGAIAEITTKNQTLGEQLKADLEFRKQQTATAKQQQEFESRLQPFKERAADIESQVYTYTDPVTNISTQILGRDMPQIIHNLGQVLSNIQSNNATAARATETANRLQFKDERELAEEIAKVDKFLLNPVDGQGNKITNLKSVAAYNDTANRFTKRPFVWIYFPDDDPTIKRSLRNTNQAVQIPYMAAGEEQKQLTSGEIFAAAGVKGIRKWLEQDFYPCTQGKQAPWLDGIAYTCNQGKK